MSAYPWHALHHRQNKTRAFSPLRLQSANQSTTEMKDKSKVLSSELDILHNEVGEEQRYKWRASVNVC